MLADKDRKKLWGRAGARCAKCNLELTRVEGIDSIVGDEAHIRSGNKTGPRYDGSYAEDLVAGYENRILLCKIDHKLIDDNESVFTTSVLTNMKAEHEKRVARALNPSTDGWIRPVEIELVQDGTQMVNLVFGASAYLLGNDHPRTEEERTAVGCFLQSVHDWGDISGDIGEIGRIDAATDLHAQMEDLWKLGFVVFAGLGVKRYRPDFDLPTVYVHIVRIGSVDVRPESS